ncbi:hypothetical protein [Methanobacterium petrolearium]|nr:hypothetical protein [Methanobacterium petrolearium]MBP1945482.1 hypothetical protein [Methanobacterium petrolearium]
MGKKSTYQKPKLKLHGTIETLTKGTGPGQGEGDNFAPSIPP